MARHLDEALELVARGRNPKRARHSNRLKKNKPKPKLWEDKIFENAQLSHDSRRQYRGTQKKVTLPVLKFLSKDHSDY
jgi:hypothetical protein